MHRGHGRSSRQWRTRCHAWRRHGVIDERGSAQLEQTRAQLVAERGTRGQYHWNGITSWKIDAKGEATNVFV